MFATVILMHDLIRSTFIIFNKIVDLLFREGGSSAPKEPPLGYGPGPYSYKNKV